MNSRKALEVIGSIELFHIEHTKVEDCEGKWTTKFYEKSDGLIKEICADGFNCIERDLIVLNLTIEKEVNLPAFIESVKSFDFTYKHYLKYKDNYSYKLLTDEEFNLIKGKFE